MKRSSREKFVQYMLSYIGDPILDVETERLCVAANVPSEGKSYSTTIRAKVLTKALDYNLFLHLAGAVRVDILQVGYLRYYRWANDDLWLENSVAVSPT